MSITRIASSQLSATISSASAELTTLKTADGLPLLWHGDPAWWSGRSPLLFPIVGRLLDDTAIIEGRPYALKQHGFARTSTFTLATASADSCSFELSESTQTRGLYPFDFLLRVTYTITAACLSVCVTVTNREQTREMPFSFGFHTAFLWPALPHTHREDYDLHFAHTETATVIRPIDGLLSESRDASPLSGGRILSLHDALFTRGAIVFDQLASREIIYRCGERGVISVAFPDLPHLGLWTKPGAPFICIEPWHGFAAPIGFTGELARKPGVIGLEPGASQTFEMRLTALCA